MTVKEGMLPVGISGKFLDTAEIENEQAHIVHRESVVITDSEDNEARLSVKKDINTGEYQLQTQDKQIQAVCDLLSEMVELQKETNMLLKGILQ